LKALWIVKSATLICGLSTLDCRFWCTEHSCYDFEKSFWFIFSRAKYAVYCFQ